MDPFAAFGMAPALDVDTAWLEARYLELSRTCHPDHHGRTAGADQVALLTRAAEVNDAYRLLRDPWQRAECLLEARAPGVLAETKTLAPTFLDDALELAEQVAQVPPGSAEADTLRRHLAQVLAADWKAVQDAVAEGAWRQAATRTHQARYHRKALRDLTP